MARWPEPRALEGWEEAKVADFALVQEIVRSIRNLRAEKDVPSARTLPATLAGGSKTALLREQAGIIAALAGLDAIEIEDRQDRDGEACRERRAGGWPRGDLPAPGRHG